MSSTSGHLHMFSLSAAIPLATTGTFFHLPSILSWLIPVIILFETLSSTFVQGSYASLPLFFFTVVVLPLFVWSLNIWPTTIIKKRKLLWAKTDFLILIPEYGCSVNINRLNEEMNKLNLADLFHIHSHYYQQNIFR